MTKEQYENLMYAMSNIIAILEENIKPHPVPHIPYDDIVKQYDARKKVKTEEIYKNLIGRGAADEK